jgi:hypothetical protein
MSVNPTKESVMSPKNTKAKMTPAELEKKVFSLQDRMLQMESQLAQALSELEDVEESLGTDNAKLNLADESFDIVARLEEFARWHEAGYSTAASRDYANTLLENLIDDAKRFTRKSAALIPENSVRH